MGKRKCSKPPPKKQRPKLEKFFSCPFCNSDKTVSAAFDWERQIGTVNCTVCQVSSTLAVRYAIPTSAARSSIVMGWEYRPALTKPSLQGFQVTIPHIPGGHISCTILISLPKCFSRRDIEATALEDMYLSQCTRVLPSSLVLDSPSTSWPRL